MAIRWGKIAVMATITFAEFDEKYFPADRQSIAHTREWIDIYENNKYSLVLAPREHTKSTTIRKYLLWTICTWLDVRILIAAHKEQLANSFAGDILRHLERDDLQQDFGYSLGKPWTRGQAFIQTEIIRPHSTATLSTVAMGAGVTGERFDIIIMDDILTVKNQRTEKNRMQLEEWINAELFPALDSLPTSKWIVVGTRKNIEDWYAKLLEMPHWTHLVQKLYTTDADGVKHYLWPERFNEDVEREKRAQMSPQEFAMEYLNEPVAGEGIRFKREWIEPYYYTSWQNDVPERHREIYIGIDPSLGSKSAESSYMALAVVVFDKRPTKQDIYVVDLVRTKVSLADQEDIIKAKIAEWNPTAAMIEDVLVNKIFSERMMRQLPILQPVIYRGWGASSGLRGTTDVSKIGRIENIVGWLFKKGKIRLKDPRISPMSKTFIEAEYLQFPEGSLDLMDALNMAVDRIDLRTKINEFKVWMY
jgi:hypothetical protein